MKKFLEKNKKNICLIIITVIAFNFLFLPLPSLASHNAEHTRLLPRPPDIIDVVGDLTGWISAKVLLFTSSFISMILGVFLGFIIGLEAQFIDYVLSPTNFPITTAPIVELGWGITRDLANMFFILILLIIAFTTVLRIKSWAIQQLWWKVVVAALLINFSLVIAGFVIDFTNILTAFFLNQITGGSGVGGVITITTKLAAGMQILNFYDPSNVSSITGGITQFGAAGIAAVVGLILTLVGLIVTAFVFGAAVIFLIVRILHLWLLLIFAPIVWMLWILPATSGQFSKWWNSFLHWAFFAPIFVFMIYLSLSIFDATGKLNPKVFGVFPAVWQTPAPGITKVGMPAAIFQWILVIAMMFGSLIVAQKFGVYGATASQKMLTGWGNSAKGWAGRELKKRGAGWTQPLPAGAPPPTGVRGVIRRVGAGFGRAAVAVPGARGAYLGLQADVKKDYENAQNKYKDVDPTVLEQMSQAKLIGSTDRLAIQSLLINKGRLKPQAAELLKMLDQSRKYGKEEDILKLVSEKMNKDLTDTNGYGAAERTELLQRAKRYGNEKNFLKFFPNLAPAIGKTIQEAVKGIEKASDIYVDQMIADVVRELSIPQLRDIGKSGSDTQRRATKIAVIQDYRGLSLSDRQSIRLVLMETNKQKREQLRATLPENLRKMSYQREITTTPAWEQNI